MPTNRCVHTSQHHPSQPARGYRFRFGGLRSSCRAWRLRCRMARGCRGFVGRGVGSWRAASAAFRHPFRVEVVVWVENPVATYLRPVSSLRGTSRLTRAAPGVTQFLEPLQHVRGESPGRIDDESAAIRGRLAAAPSTHRERAITGSHCAGASGVRTNPRLEAGTPTTPGTPQRLRTPSTRPRPQP